MVGLVGLLSISLALPAAEGLALRCGKVLTMDATDTVHAPGMIWVEGGKLTYVGALREELGLGRVHPLLREGVDLEAIDD